jgi:tRNA/tmRNA/rRNA uracil-C5-methylase (TrmA/RlmC/RlmD family)
LQFAGEVLSVVSHQTVAQAEKNAECNNIKNVQYFDGSSVEALPKIAEKISCDKACAVVICSGGKYLWMLCLMFSH